MGKEIFEKYKVSHKQVIDYINSIFQDQENGDQQNGYDHGKNGLDLLLENAKCLKLADTLLNTLIERIQNGPTSASAEKIDKQVAVDGTELFCLENHSISYTVHELNVNDVDIEANGEIEGTATDPLNTDEHVIQNESVDAIEPAQQFVENPSNEQFEVEHHELNNHNERETLDPIYTTATDESVFDPLQSDEPAAASQSSGHAQELVNDGRLFEKYNIATAPMPSNGINESSQYELLINDNHNRNLVMEAISQLESDNDMSDDRHLASADSTTTPMFDFHMDIQAEVNVTTTTADAIEEDEDDVEEPKSEPEAEPEPEPTSSRPKRKSMMRPELKEFLKRRSSICVAPEPSNEASKKRLKFAKAMGKRHSKVRKMVSFERPENQEDDSDDDGDNKKREMSSMGSKNTDQRIYAANSLYRTLCIYCNKNVARGLVRHYVNVHPDCEVPIARVSLKMAVRLRLKSDKYQRVDGKVMGMCHFCEENRIFPKCGWEKHLLVHTGEYLFKCNRCHVSIQKKREHNAKCNGTLIRIFRASKNSLVIGFLCKECNYLQIARDQMLKHLEIEHEYLGPMENHHFESVTLVATPQK